MIPARSWRHAAFGALLLAMGAAGYNNDDNDNQQTQEKTGMTAEQRIEIARSFLDKLGALDIDGAGEYVAEDAVMLFPFFQQPGPYEGKETILNQFRSTLPNFWERMEFHYKAWYPTVDPDVLIAEFDSKAIKKGNTGTYENEYITVFKFRGDKLVLIKEYFNPSRLNVDI